VEREIIPVNATHKLAFIIDNEVVQVFECDERLAAILLSEPVVVDITAANPIENMSHADYDPATKTITVRDTNYKFPEA